MCQGAPVQSQRALRHTSCAGFSAFDASIEATRALPASHLIDLSERYCDALACFPVIGNVIVYRDNNHITATFARTLTPFLLEHLERALE
jgi:hypothetical protein